LRAIVVAYGANRGIGYRGQLPWRLPSDLRRFRELTIGGTVLMGRKTYESLPPAYRPLPERRNVIVSGKADFRPAGVEVCDSVEAGLRACGADCFVIGGGSVYEQALARCERVYATLVRESPLSDTYFPELPPEQWHCSERAGDIWENGTHFHFATYDRLR
jgi:dihydrofolate reductase